MKILLPALTSALICTTLACTAYAADDKAAARPVPANTGNTAAQNPAPYAAVVNGKVIGAAQFDTALNEAARQKFYHAKPPEGAAEELARTVAGDMIDRILLLEEIKRRGMKPNAQAVDEKIAAYEARYATSSRWQQERAAILPALRERLEEDDLLAAIEARTRSIPTPSEDKVLAYYKKHPEKFTEPEKFHLSMILLAVDPSSPTAAWLAADAEAGSLRLQIAEGGAAFADVARKHSNHDSSAMGGDLGYLHRGMLPEGIQDKIDTMKPGDLSQPTRILQGVALFRYESHREPKHHDFATVKGRAADLLARDSSDDAWTKLKEQLRKKARIELNAQRYPALAPLASQGK